MVDFTTLMNRGIRRFLARTKRGRKFGKCEDCGTPSLLLEYKDPYDTETAWKVCERCFIQLQINENK